MKQILSLILSAGFFVSMAQSLTLAGNKPVSGDVYNWNTFDSITSINKVTGIGKVWNFNNFIMNQTPASNRTYTAASSALNSSSFPGASVAAFDASDPNTAYEYYKVNGSNFEFMGVTDNSPSTISFSNTGIEFVYPLSFGSSYSDTYGGSGTFSTSTATYEGTLSVLGAGTGTVVLPGNTSLSNCLQVVTNRTVNLDIGGGLTFTVTSKSYDYYHSSQKFPAISIVYSKMQGAFGPSDNVNILVNKVFVAGVRENAVTNSIHLYPNPAIDKLKIDLNGNIATETAQVLITEPSGKIAKKITLSFSGNSEFDISDLNPGFYILVFTFGDRSYYSRFVKQ